MEEQVETTDLREQQITPSKYAGLGFAMTAELLIGLVGVGVILSVGVVDNLDHFIRAVTRGK